jgi:hypothetical protein
MHKESVAEQLPSGANGTTSGTFFNTFSLFNVVILRILYFYSVMLLHTCISHDFGICSF